MTNTPFARSNQRGGLLLKPVEAARLRPDHRSRPGTPGTRRLHAEETDRVRQAAADYEEAEWRQLLHRIPVRRRDEIVLVPVNQLISVVAESGSWLHLRTTDNETHTSAIDFAIFAPAWNRQVRSAGPRNRVNIEMIRRIVPMPGGTFTVVLADNQEFRVSRIQSRLSPRAPAAAVARSAALPLIVRELTVVCDCCTC